MNQISKKPGARNLPLFLIAVLALATSLGCAPDEEARDCTGVGEVVTEDSETGADEIQAFTEVCDETLRSSPTGRTVDVEELYGPGGKNAGRPSPDQPRSPRGL